MELSVWGCLHAEGIGEGRMVNRVPKVSPYWEPRHLAKGNWLHGALQGFFYNLVDVMKRVSKEGG